MQLCLSEMLTPQLQYTRKGLSIATLSPKIFCSPTMTS
jgi:hypothetical protein